MKLFIYCLTAFFVVYLNLLSLIPVYAAEPDIQYTIANDVSTSNMLEFDLLLFDPDPTQDFQLATVQAGVYMNPNAFTGGTVTAQIIAGTSTLNASQVPTSIAFTGSAHIIKLAAKAPPGCGGGTIISKDPLNRTRICRIRLTNSIPWVSCTNADLTFCFTTTPYPTKISYYSASDCIGTAVTVNSTNCFSMASNQTLITPGPPPPIAFSVTGSGSYCPGGVGIQVGLSNSETDVTYVLYKDGVPLSPNFIGTGTALSFGTQTVGTYTVKGIRYGCGTLVTWMAGSAIVSYYSPTVGGAVNGPDSAVEGSSTVILNLSGQTGNVLKWQKRLRGGSWTDIPMTTTSYSEVPTPIGNWEYRAVVQNGDCDILNSSSWNVIVIARTLTVKLFLQGLYRVNTGLMEKTQDENGDHFPGDIADVIDLSLVHNSYPYGIEFTVENVALPRNGIITIDLPSGSFMSYFLRINHRNSVETWSSFPVNLSSEANYYNFTNGVYKAYGYNMFQMCSVWVFYTGDVNQDGIIDSGDMIPTENLNSAFATGYLPEDNNGDGLIDSSDMSMIGNNAAQFVGKVTP